MYTKEQIEKAVKAKSYKWFEDQINIVSVRNSVPGSKVTNVFDDTITVSYKENNVWKFFSWVCTTDPGTKGVKEFHNTRGVAVLVPGQYINSHIIRKHQGKYDAVCQDGPVKVFRDRNKDMKFDMDPATIDTGVFGINIHRSNPTTESTYVENWSEGCSVFKRVKDFNEFMKICNALKTKQGNKFTYTLLTSADIK